MIRVIDGADALLLLRTPGAENEMGSIVRIELGEKGVPRGNTISLKYDDVTVQREVATGDDGKLVIETFSGASASLVANTVRPTSIPRCKVGMKTQSR